MIFFKRKIELECISGYVIDFKYNPLYISCKNGIIRNKTTEKRYLISNTFLVKRNWYYQSGDIPSEAQMIIYNEKQLKTFLNVTSSLILDGKFFLMLQIEPHASVSINDITKSFYKKEESVARKNVVAYDLENDLKNQRTRELNYMINLDIKKKIDKMIDHFSNGKKNIIYIGDKFTYGNLKNRFNVYNLEFCELELLEYILERFYREIEIDFLFVESLWEGKNNSFFFKSPVKRVEAVSQVINACKEKWIKVVFYNKEDPIHFDSFLPIAKMADYVITTDSNMIKNYKNHGIKNVSSFVFFINEKIFNPFHVDSDSLEEKIFFAGSYYPKYPDRCEFVHTTFSHFYRDFSLEIIDRNRNLKHTPNVFPVELKKNITNGGMSVEKLVEYTKKFKYTINLNSVINSDTMIARRVFEQIALGKIVISNYAKSISKSNLEGLIYDVDNNYDSLSKQMLELPNDIYDILRRSYKILREYSAPVFENKLYEFIKMDKSEYRIYVYVKISSLDDYVRLMKSLANQNYSQYVILIETTNDVKEDILMLCPNRSIEFISDIEKDTLNLDNPVLIYDINKVYLPNMILDSVITLAIFDESYDVIGFANDSTMNTINYETRDVRNLDGLIYKSVRSYINNEDNGIAINMNQYLGKNAKTYVRADMVINNMYPSNQNLYAHAFVHSRIKKFEDKNYYPFVVILANQKVDVTTYFYDGVLVFNVNKNGFKFINDKFNIQNFAIHFINKYIGETLAEYVPQHNKTIWFHGADCLLAKHKKSLYNLEQDKDKIDFARREKVMNAQFEFLKTVFNNDSYMCVFVSKWLYDTVSNDYGKKIDNSLILSNPIDTDYFHFVKKEIKDGEKIRVLSIRPFPEFPKQYANDVLVKAIVALSKRPIFAQLEFDIIGNGPTFQDELKPLMDLKKENIRCMNKFLTKAEIRQMHQECHIMMMPNRQDTHGVSIFEAVASGLLGIASNNSAKPEYLIDKETGFLHETEDYNELADIVEYCAKNYNNIADVRENGRKYVEEKSEINKIIDKEIQIMQREKK